MVQVELKDNGAELPVTYDTRTEFADLVLKARLNEAEQQIASLRKGTSMHCASVFLPPPSQALCLTGLNAVVPVGMLSLFSWGDLELMVCGNPEIDIESLRKHTIYKVR